MVSSPFPFIESLSAVLSGVYRDLALRRGRDTQICLAGRDRQR